MPQNNGIKVLLDKS